MDTIQNRSERRQYWSEEPNTATEEVVIAEEKSTQDVNREATDPSEESQEESRDFKYPLTLSKSFPATIKFTAVKTEGVDISEKIGKAVPAASQPWREPRKLALKLKKVKHNKRLTFRHMRIKAVVNALVALNCLFNVICDTVIWHNMKLPT